MEFNIMFVRILLLGMIFTLSVFLLEPHCSWIRAGNEYIQGLDKKIHEADKKIQENNMELDQRFEDLKRWSEGQGIPRQFGP
jgi:hypothetical protein